MICFAKEFVIFLVSPFIQLQRKRKMAARIFFHSDHLAEVVLPGRPFLRPGQYHRTFLDSGQYRKYLMFSAMQIEWKAFLGRLLLVCYTDYTVFLHRHPACYHLHYGVLEYSSRVVRKPGFFICKNKDADQLLGNREADQRLCFCYTDSTIPLLPKSKMSSL